MVRPLSAAFAACFLLTAPALASESKSVPAPRSDLPWLAVHRETGLWSGPSDGSQLFALAEPGARFQLARPQSGSRLLVWDPRAQNYAWIESIDVGPANGRARQPLSQPAAPVPSALWDGTASVTMYTCVELGGCKRTASGIWPYEGVVAVDPHLIPLGSVVWIDGLGSFLAADTGAAVRGSHVDVYVDDYGRARDWGVQYLHVIAYETP